MHTNMWVVDNVVERKKYYPQLQEAAKLLRENEADCLPYRNGIWTRCKRDE